MNLHNDEVNFRESIIRTSEYFNIAQDIIVKDYFVTLFLKTLKTNLPNFIFKGGTSLSKCYKAINRFSEDIDISYYADSKENITQRTIKESNRKIKDTIEELGFKYLNNSEFKSGRKFQRYLIQYSYLEQHHVVRDHSVVENTLLTLTFPVAELKTNSLIAQYLEENNFTQVIEDYQLEPFFVYVQDISRTFIDKVFALCDYYIEKNEKEHSRHLYDLYMITAKIGALESIIPLIDEVRNERINTPKCYSAGENINKILKEMIENEFYKNDYEKITSKLLYEQVTYDDVIRNLEIIIKSNIFRTNSSPDLL